MLSGRPLYDTDPDRALFVATGAWARLGRAVRLGLNVAVFGDRGSGRTTMLRALQRELRLRGVPVAFVDATAVPDLATLAARVQHELLGARSPLRDVADDAVRLGKALSGELRPGAASLRVVDRVRSLADVAPTTVLIDCTRSTGPAYELFGRLRDELWHLEHRWVVAGELDERGRLLAPPADAFFEQVITLDPWTAQERADLLSRRGIPAPAEGLDAFDYPTPRALLRALADREVAGGAAQDDPLITRRWRERRAAEMGRSHSMALAELEGLGQASASDESLLSRLGWSRPRASQVLNELAREGVVVTSMERLDGRGRPRRVFRPATVVPEGVKA